MSALQSCMGGFCRKRDSCANYHAASEHQQPSERLCPPGRDGAEMSRHHEAAVHFSGFTFNLKRESQTA